MDAQTKKQQRRRSRGMTLIEIMVVITILGLIAAAVGVAVIPQLNAARVDRARLDIRNRYRGSVLGPFWLTLSTAVMVGGLGLLYSSLFKLPLAVERLTR